MHFARRRSRPPTSTGVPSKGLVDRDAPLLPKVSIDTGTGMQGSLEQLGLHLSSSNDDVLAPVFTDEPDEITERAGSAASTDTHTDTDARLEEEAGKTSTQPRAVKDFNGQPQHQHQQEAQPKRLLLSAVPSRPTDASTDADPSRLLPQRLSLQFRNASDSRLSASFQKAALPPLPGPAHLPVATPAIITTAPPRLSHDEPRKKVSMQALFSRANSTLRRDSGFRNSFARHPINPFVVEQPTHSLSESTPDLAIQEEPAAASGPGPARPPSKLAPPAYGDEASSQLAIPVDRLSDSSRSDGSDHRLKRKKKTKGSLFPLLDKIPPPSDRPSLSRPMRDSMATLDAPALPRKSTSPSRKSTSPSRKSTSPSRKSANVRFDNLATPPFLHASPTQSALALTNSPFGSPGPTVPCKESDQSGYSTPTGILIPPRLGTRGRTSTISSFGPSAERLADGAPQLPPSGRTSTSTTGRRSFGDLLSLPQRLRQNSNPPARHSSASTPGTPGSKPNSVYIPREPEPQPQFAYPKREDDETPASYLERLEAAVPRSSIATILCKTSDDFSKTCLRKYMRGFSYFGESIDLAIRKMLMEVELPKETQQIDRLLTGFADRYHECNPGIFTSTEETAFVAFSILLLHSDTHNKNNKRKMTKHDYFKNTQQGPVQVSADILDCFYDNICYTPFIHFEDEVAINSHRRSIPRPKKSLIRSKSSEKPHGPIDPYILILDNKLDALRPSLKDVMDTEDTYKHCGTAPSFDCHALCTAFAKSAVLQIVSARSRPDAFMHQNTIANPAEAQAGLVSFKVAKVGLLWRKDPKKKKAQRTWQEWGAILTDSKLYFFKDIGWTKRLISQYDSHARAKTKSALVFKPPLQSFSADAWMNIDDSVALMDTSYKRHKHAFTFIKHGGFEEIFLANSEADMNDWIGKLNYAATFRTAGLLMRGAGVAPHDARRLRKNSDISTLSADTLTKDSPAAGPKTNPQSEWEIAFYRRQLISERISDLDDKIAAAQKELDHLLRNARHLLVLLPIQVKTREAIILAAGRMSAKLRWTRVELWRAKTHQEILTNDLDQESPSDFPAPRLASPQKITPVKGQQGLARTNTDTSDHPLSPISSISPIASRQGQPAIDRLVQSTPASRNPSITNSPTLTNHGFDRDGESQSSLLRSTSVTHLPRPIPASATDPDSQVVHDDGIPSPNTTPTTKAKDNRPPTSESERDHVGTISPDLHKADRSDRPGSIRRSLHRTLRDSHGSFHSHHSPSLHRHKKGRGSGSSTANDDSLKASNADSNSELKRGTGSFILHGKKASVITMGTEWPAMSHEERMKMKIDETKSERENGKEEEHIEEGDEDTISQATTGQADNNACVPRASITSTATAATATEDEFVDASSLKDEDVLSKDALLWVQSVQIRANR
ncbi:hypothetical protein DV736_g360, partial [Chaetothyriales sp. CBS 134916]